MSRLPAPSRRARPLWALAAASFAVCGAAVVVAASGSAGAYREAPPGSLGDDESLDALAEQCFTGELTSCDLLFLQSPVGSEYEAYGDTCAGRQGAGGEEYCILGRTDGGVSGDPSTPGGPDDTAPVDSAPGTSDPGALEPGQLPDPTLEPVGLGDDPELDGLAEECYDGDMTACDTLYGRSESGTDYRLFGDTCAGRQPEGTGRLCAMAFAIDDGPGSSDVPASTEPVVVDTTLVPASLPPLPGGSTSVPLDPVVGGELPPATAEPTGLGSDPVLDGLAQSCFDGDMESCDQLWRDAEPGSAYREYGDTCAGRQPAESGYWCTTTFPGATTVTTPTTPTTSPVTTAPVVTVPDTTVAVVGSEIPPATVEPTGLGTDPVLDGLAQQCYDGSLESCDELWRQSEAGTDYRLYGDTCAGRQEPDTGRWCVDAFTGATTVVPTSPSTTVFVPPPPSTIPPSTIAPSTTAPVPGGIPPAAQPPTGLGTDPVLDALAQQCYDGDMVACDSLFDAAPMKSAYQAYGDTCAGRQATGTFKYCQAAFPTGTEA